MASPRGTPSPRSSEDPRRPRRGAPVRTLLVISDEALRRTVGLTLRHGDYACRSVASVGDAVASLDEWRPHLILVDIELESGRGMQVLDEAGAHEPIAAIALARRGDLGRKLEAFERGADDYINVPFVPDDLVARAHAVVRRVHGGTRNVVPHLRIGDLEIDVLNRKVRVGESELHLTSLEQALLYLLAANAGTVLTREQILDAIWGADPVTESNVVERHVRTLRAKLQDDWHRPRYIETVPGTGYRFVPIDDPPRP